MNVVFQPVTVAIAGERDGVLAFCQGELVAVLVRLSDLHAEAGRWFLEAGFGQLDGPAHPSFADLHEAEAWIAARCGARV